MHKQSSLSNGLKLITIPMSGTKTATILLMVGTGSKYENRKNNGISHFLEHMFFKGTKKRGSAMAISAELDGVGGEYNAFTSKEYTGYWVKVDASKIRLAMDVVSDMILNSKFSAAEIEREKGVIIEEFNMYRDNPMYFIEDVFEECLYGDTPSGWDVIGTKENITNFKREDFTSYFKSQYGVGNIIVCAAGNLNANFKNEASKYFSAIKDSKFQDKEAVVESQLKPEIKVHYKKTDQAHISIGVRAFGYFHPDKHIAKIIAVILGSSMSSRLFIQLRERRGLAYYVRTNAELNTDAGYLTTQAGVPVNKVEEALQVILAEYNKIKKIAVQPKELNKVKDLIRGRSTIALESSDNMTNWFAKQAVLNFSQKNEKPPKQNILTPEDYFRKIEKITSDDILRVARDIFVPEKLNLAVIGPYKDKKVFEKILKF